VTPFEETAERSVSRRPLGGLHGGDEVVGDLLLGAVRLAHALAAALWVGGAMLFTLAPALRGGVDNVQSRRVRDSLRIGVAVFILTGVIMAAERLGSAPLPPTYVAALALKIGLAAWMFAIARSLGRARGDADKLTQRLLVLGGLVYALALALRSMYEHAIRT
jgi:hypothetical protein